MIAKKQNENVDKKLFLHLLFPLSIPLFNPGSPLLAPFSSRRCGTSASPRTPKLSPTTAVPIVPIRSSPISIAIITTVPVPVPVPKLLITPVAWTGAPAPAPTPSELAVPPKQLPS